MKLSLKWLFALGATVSTMAAANAATPPSENKPLYLDVKAPIEERVEDALARMTLEEKVALCHAQSKFSIKGVPRLGIHELWMSDGPHGVRAEFNWDNWNYAGWGNDSCTAFPALVCLAATWNPEMAALYGKSIGEEARFRKKDVLLGPGVNICRTPLNGRSFEYLGEDPFLTSAMAVPWIREVQKNGVAVCVKHYAVNNQETDRLKVDVEVSDRALREIYLPAFYASAVKGKAWSFMGAYNKYRGEHCCHNHRLINEILKDEWGFDGVLISDWGGVHDTREGALNGLDIEMGTHTDGLTYTLANAYEKYYLAHPYLMALRNGEVPVETVDDKARRILRLIFRTVMSDNRPWGSFATEEHAAAGRKIAQEGIVLLKNNGILPLDPAAGKRILVVGENATRSLIDAGGSSELKTWRDILPLAAIEEAYGKENVSYALGYHSGPSVYNKVIPSTMNADSLRSAAVDAAKSADAVIFVGGLNKNFHQDCENGDRKEYELPFGQEQLISELAAVNSNIVVVLLSGNAVATDWVSQVGALVQGWHCGSETGHALVDIISGAVNPSGKLPVSFYAKLTDCGAHAFDDECYPGVNLKQVYKDDIYVGYRYLNKNDIRPAYPFGFGLSYTTFKLGDPKADAKVYGKDDTIRVKVEVTNTGDREGCEVVQLYVSKPKSAVDRAPRELKAFRKVQLASGEKASVELEVPVSSLAYWNTGKNGWETESGEYVIYTGNSSEASQKVKVTVR